MKKLLVLMAAAFAMVACQTDINEVGVAGGEVDVTFEVGTPTRAYSDGKTATVLQYAVYEGETELTALTRSLEGNNPDSINISKTVSFKLVTGNKYTVIFWAAAPEAPYTVDFDAKTMTVNYNGVESNKENLDAFYAKHEFTVKGAQTETIELKRPFAQLNIGTNDYAAAAEAGYEPIKSAVKVTNVYKTLDLWEGKVSTPVEILFDYNTIAKSEIFPYDDTNYDYLAMNYLLVPAEKEVVDIEFSYTETDAAAAKTRIVGSVPVQRNYRTNIYGQLLTSDVNINVEIKPEYKDEHNVESGLFSQVADVVSLQEAIDAAPENELTTIILTEDIDLSATRALGYITRVENGSNIVIDGNGHTIKGGIRIVGQSIKQNETTVIRNINFYTDQNELDFIASSDFGFGDNFWRYANNVTVENCTFTAATLSADPKVVGVRFNQAYNVTVKNCVGTNLHSLCQFQSNDTAIVLEGLKAVNCEKGISLGTTKKVTINGLEIDAKEYGLRVDGNSLQSGTRCSLSVENATITAAQPIIARRVTVAYDLTLGENVVLNSTELHQVIFTAGADDAAYVAPAEGSFSYTSANDFVVFPYVVAVSTWEELVATTASKVVLAADVTFASNYQWNKAMTLDLNGKSITLPMINIHSAATFKNGTINGKVYARKGANIVLDNVTLSGAVSDNLSTEGHLAIQSGCTLYVKDCLFSPTSVSGSQTKPISFEGGSSNMKFENCEFKSSPYKKQVYFNPLSATASLEFVNCNFNNKTPNIMFAAAAPLTVLKMNGTTKLGSVTLETNRAKDAVTAEDLAYLRESLIANNSMSSVRLFYAGGSSEYVR